VVLAVLGEALDHVGVLHHGASGSGLEIEASLKCLPGARDHPAAVCDQSGLGQLGKRLRRTSSRSPAVTC
jgi:hypothetical protein